MFVRRILKDWKIECGTRELAMWKYSHCKNKVTICTPQPSLFIGKGGCLYNKYLALLKEKLCNDDIQVEFIETDYDIL